MDRKQIAQYVEQCLKEGGVMWMYDGPPRPDKPHALLASGKHSNGYVDVGSYIKANAKKRQEFARFLLELIPAPQRGFTCVVGADTSSTDLAADVARLEGSIHIRMVKTEVGSVKKQRWAEDNRIIGSKKMILQVEELITMAHSALEVREGVRFSKFCIQPVFFPILPVIVDRSDPDKPVEFVEGSRVESLLRLPIKNFPAEECPYCAAGSVAIKPKEGDSWKQLTGVAK